MFFRKKCLWIYIFRFGKILFTLGVTLVHLFVCLCAGYLKKLWTDPDEILWIGWVCDKDERITFWWRSRSGSNYYNFWVILHHWEIRPKMIYSTISQKVVDGFRWNLVDTLCVLQELIDSILVKIWIQELFNFLKWFFTFTYLHLPICSRGSGITWWRYVLYRVPF